MRTLPIGRDGRRTREADALTLLDETSLVLAGAPAAIDALERARVRGDLDALDGVVRAHSITVHCLGHALLEHRRFARPPIGAGVVTLAVVANDAASTDVALADAIARGRFAAPDFAPTLPWPHAVVDAWVVSALR
jgi:hypothetical protein